MYTSVVKLSLKFISQAQSIGEERKGCYTGTVDWGSPLIIVIMEGLRYVKSAKQTLMLLIASVSLL